MANQYLDIETLSYDEAIAETEALLSDLEKEKLPINAILEKSKRVVALIQHCRTQITKINSEVATILESLKLEGASSSDTH